MRDRLAAALRAEGLRTEVRAATGATSSGVSAQVAHVENVVATLPGTDPTGAVVLVAHYDSVASGPGAAGGRCGDTRDGPPCAPLLRCATT